MLHVTRLSDKFQYITLVYRWLRKHDYQINFSI